MSGHWGPRKTAQHIQGSGRLPAVDALKGSDSRAFVDSAAEGLKGSW